MKGINLTNLLFWLTGLIALLIGIIIFILIVAGIDTGADDPVRSGVILFVSFIMCSGLAFGGLIIMALTQISSTLQRIEKILKDREEAANDKNKKPESSGGRKGNP